MPFDYSATTTRERLESAASQNVLILQTISETTYATSEYQKTNKFINDLRREVALEERNLSKVNSAVDIEYAQHKKYRESHVKRLAYKIGGKKDQFEADATKEEKEWLDAVAVHIQTERALEHLKLKLAEAVKKNADLMDVMRVRTTHSTIDHGNLQHVGGSSSWLQRIPLENPLIRKYASL